MPELVARFGPLHLSQIDDYFFTLVESIISQQLSGKVADTITRRLRALVGADVADDEIDVGVALTQQARGVEHSLRMRALAKGAAFPLCPLRSQQSSSQWQSSGPFSCGRIHPRRWAI